MRAHWSELILVHDDAGTVRDANLRHDWLTELKNTGKMTGAFLTRTWGRHENPTDRRTWGPLLREIDWTGFGVPVAAALE